MDFFWRYDTWKNLDRITTALHLLLTLVALYFWNDVFNAVGQPDCSRIFKQSTHVPKTSAPAYTGKSKHPSKTDFMFFKILDLSFFLRVSTTIITYPDLMRGTVSSITISCTTSWSFHRCFPNRSTRGHYITNPNNALFSEEIPQDFLRKIWSLNFDPPNGWHFNDPTFNLTFPAISRIW